MYARQTARSMMQDPFEVELLRSRDTAIYGTPDGPTFQRALEKAREQLATSSAGAVSDIEVCEQLIRSASHSNQQANALFEE